MSNDFNGLLFECYSFISKKSLEENKKIATEKYTKKYGLEPKNIFVEFNMLWLGPLSKKDTLYKNR